MTLICASCKTKTKILYKHHIVPKSCGGTDHEKNITKICEVCHSKIHSRPLLNISTLTTNALSNFKIKRNIANTWLIENFEFAQKAFNDLAERNYNEYDLYMTLIENDNMNSEHIMDWCLGKKVKIKTMFTF